MARSEPAMLISARSRRPRGSGRGRAVRVPELSRPGVPPPRPVEEAGAPVHSEWAIWPMAADVVVMTVLTLRSRYL